MSAGLASRLILSRIHRAACESSHPAAFLAGALLGLEEADRLDAGRRGDVLAAFRAQGLVTRVPADASTIRKGARVRTSMRLPAGVLPLDGVVRRRHGLRVWVVWDGAAAPTEHAISDVVLA